MTKFLIFSTFAAVLLTGITVLMENITAADADAQKAIKLEQGDAITEIPISMSICVRIVWASNRLHAATLTRVVGRAVRGLS